MPTLHELLEQRDALEREIRTQQAAARSQAVSQVLAIMNEHQLSIADLTGVAKASKPSQSKVKVAPKFIDRVSGQAWSGRGLQPNWLKAKLAAGAKLEDFSVKAA